MTKDEWYREGYRRGLKDARDCVGPLLDELGRRAREGSLDEQLRGGAFVADNNLMTCENGDPYTLGWATWGEDGLLVVGEHPPTLRSVPDPVEEQDG